MLMLVKGPGPIPPWLTHIANHGILETDTSWCWPFWPLSLPTGERRIPGAYPTAH